jgi:hypothetical protein
MKRSQAADRIWEEEYYRRAEIRAGGVVGAIIGRAEPQLLRLSMLAALCRREDVVDAEDLTAAVDLWRYVDETVRMLFASCEDPLVARIIDTIRAEPGISRSTLHRLTAKAMSADRFVAALERAAATGAVESDRLETGGRPREVWRPRSIKPSATATAGEKGEKGQKATDETFSPISPLSPGDLPARRPGSPRPSSKHGRTL